MSDQLKLDFDVLQKDGILKFGRKYQLAINLYVVDNNGKDVLDTTTGKPMIASEQKTIPFEIPTFNEPIVFDEMWADTDSDDNMKLHFKFNVSDANKVIMTDSNKDNAYYYAKLWKVDEDNKLTDCSNKVDGLVDSDGNPTTFEIGKTYNFSLDNPGNSAKYRLILYAAVDLNNDGKADGLTSLEGSITQLTKDDFEANKSTLQMYIRNDYTTPSSSGITLGTQSIAACSTDNTKAEITYKNAVGLNNIDRVVYTLSSEDGVTYTKTMENDDKAHPLFVQKTGGYFTLTLDSVLQNKGKYNVVVQYYVANADGTYTTPLATYSDIYVY